MIQGLHLRRLAVLERDDWVTRTLLGRFKVVCSVRFNSCKLIFGSQWVLYQTAEIGQLSFGGGLDNVPVSFSSLCIQMFSLDPAAIRDLN